MEVLEERNGSDTELLMFALTLINKVGHGTQVATVTASPTSHAVSPPTPRLWPSSQTRTPSTTSPTAWSSWGWRASWRST